MIATRPIERLNLATLLQQESALQRSLVEDFLQCRTTNLVDLSKIKLNSNARQISFIDLDENLLVLVRDAYQTQTVLIPLSQAVKEALSSFRISLQGSFYELPVAQLNQRSYELYQTLIQPLEEKQLIQPGNQLLITSDPNFYDLPFSVLWTGRNYLIENYQILNSLGGQTTEASPGISPVMITAITDSSGLPPSYPDGIDSSIEAEVQNIEQMFKTSVILLNKAFQADSFLEMVTKEGFHTLHVSTHGVFDATSRNPYLYAWDRKVPIAELNQALLQRSPLNLLVFSACETIRANPRAIIGLASSAVQAQSRNLVASLWKVDAEATAKFMTEFYNQLRQGKTPAVALQAAQIQLIHSDNEMNHPYYWAGFLLFGVD
uniref:CHAT domain-containing protein n=1 Tax=Oscillatoriales cyanobacterium SpSt-418 TaxID=2282169 RepID=A0A7C3KG60_9CYAN